MSQSTAQTLRSTAVSLSPPATSSTRTSKIQLPTPSIRFFKRCFVSHRILRDGRPIKWLYREALDEERDSGWRFTAGDETDEYLTDSKNVSYIAVGVLLNRDDSFVGLLDSPIGSAFERTPDGRFASHQS